MAGGMMFGEFKIPTTINKDNIYNNSYLGWSSHQDTK